MGYLKGVGRIYQQTVLDTYSSVAFAKLYTSKVPVTAADVLNDRVLPFFEKQQVPLLRMLTDRGTEYCGRLDAHPHELFLQLNEIEHTKTKAGHPQTKAICERFLKTVLDEFYRVEFRRKIFHSLEELQEDLDAWISKYNNERTHQGKRCQGRTPMQTFIDGRLCLAEAIPSREEIVKQDFSVLRSVLFVALALSVVGVIGASAAQAPAATSEAALDRVVERTMETFSVPGIAVGIIKDGKLVLAKGYGVREAGKPAPVDADTLFGIASNTKAFTAASLAILAEEGKLGWDDRVVDHLPRFQLADPYVTREFTIRDLLTHRSGLGLGAGDLMIWPSTDFTREEIIARLKFLPPVTSFRSQFAYDNLLYMVAGEVVAAASGKSWEDFVEERILDRLDMAPCAVVHSRIEPGFNNIAVPHVPVGGNLEVVKPDAIEAIAAAGAIRCNINGMAKWLIVQLAGGKMADGTVLFGADQHKEMWSPQTLEPVSEEAYALNRTHFQAYGLGWQLDDFHGYKRVSHTGGLLGMVSYVNLVPELDLGVIVLTNQQSGAAMTAISQHVLTSYMGTGERDWVGYYRERVESAGGGVRGDRSQSSQLRRTREQQTLAAAHRLRWNLP